MADFSENTRNQIVDWLVGVSNPSPVAASRYLALYDGDPQAAGTEVTTTIRATGRIELTASMSAATSGLASNISEINFGKAATGSSGTQFDHVAIFDAVSAGTLLTSDILTGGQQTVTEGNLVKIKVGDLTVSVV